MNMATTMLIVEDEALVGMQLSRIFTRLGYEVCAAAVSGEEAIQAVRDNHPDVVLMDRRLAGKIDGLDTMRQIRAFSQTLIIFITGYLDEDLKEQVLHMPPSAYCIKPIDIDELRATIDSFLDKNKT
jgi:DNA-binding response OmpR family regulator